MVLHGHAVLPSLTNTLILEADTIVTSWKKLNLEP